MAYFSFACLCKVGMNGYAHIMNVKIFRYSRVFNEYYNCSL